MARFEITSPDGRRFEITAPDGTSQEDALAYAQQQMGVSADEEPKDQDGPITRGWNKMVQSVGITGALATKDTEGAARRVAEAAQYQAANPGSPEGNELMAAWQRGDGISGGLSEVAGEFKKDWNNAPSTIAALRGTGKNMLAMGAGVVEQTPNMLIPMAGMIGGGAAGAATPIPGGMALGAFGGASAGNALVEGGGMAQEALHKAGINPHDTAAVRAYLDKNGDTLLAQAGIKGAVIGAIDTATMGIGGKLLMGPGKAAAGRALLDMGVDITDKAAVKAAMASTDLAARVAVDPIYKAATTGGRGLARNATVAAMEPGGEFAGEYLGQGLATGDYNEKEAFLEAASSIGQSSATFAGQKLYAAAKYPFKSEVGADGTAPQTYGPGDTGTVDAADVLGETVAGPAAATESDKALYTPKNLTALDRVNEIDTTLAAPGITPEAAAPMVAERDSITASWPKASPGAETSFSTETGARLAGQYALMEAGDLTTSHDESLRPTATYPVELQPRERERHASELQVQQIVGKLDPARLGESADVATGSPIVGADGLVESGNARTIALKRVYQANGQKAIDYKTFLKDNADRFGLTPEAIDAMQKPVLVRVRTTPVNRAEFARQANASTVARMSPGEQAKSDAAQIDSLDDLNPDESGDFVSGTSRPFVRRFLSKLAGTEQAGLIDATGQLSQAGYTRIRNAVLAKAYGDSPVLLRMVESLDDNTRNVSKALLRVAPQVAKAREAIGEGALHDVDMTPDLMAAVEELSDLKEKGVSIEQALAQAGMFGDKLSPEATQMLVLLSENARSPRRIADFIQAYLDALTAAGNPAQGSVFGDTAAPSKADLMAAARRTTNGEPATRSPDAGSAEPAQEDRGQPQDAPGDQAGDGGNEAARRAAASDDFREALNDLGAIVRDYANVARIVPENAPGLMDTMVRLFEAAIKLGFHDTKKAIAYVKAQLKADDRYKAIWNKILPETYRKAAMRAADNVANEGMFGQQNQEDRSTPRVTESQVPAPSEPGKGGVATARGGVAPGIPDGWTLAANKNEWIDEHGFVRALKLTERERQAEQALYDQILADRSALLEKYLTKVLKPSDGLLVDPDRVKELSSHFLDDPQLAEAVHEPSSDLSKWFFERMVLENIEKPVIFTAGGGGSGKTEAMPHALKAAGLDGHDGVVFDSTLSAFDSARKKIDRVVNAGGEAVIVYTNSPLEKAFTFAMGRKRVVPIRVIAHAHKGASDTARKLAEHYKGNANVRLIFVNNFGEIGDIHVGGIDELPRYDYNESVKRLYEIAKEARNDGRISSERFQALVAGTDGFVLQGGSRLVGGVQEGESQGESQGLPGQPERTQGHQGADGVLEEGGLNEPDRDDGAPGAQGQSAGPARATQRQRGAQQLRDGQGSGDLFADNQPGAPDGGSVRVQQDRGSDRAGADHERGAGAGAGSRAGRATGIPAGRDIPAKSGRNYRFTDDDLTYAGGWPKKAAQNVEAVELAKKLQTEGRQATRDEQAILAKFIGWGASEIRNKIFSPRPWELDATWKALRERVRGILTAEELATAERSTQYAHYTSRAVVQSMWKAVERMGFKGGAILEPGAGIGVFPGLMDSAMATNSTYTGIEFDALTGEILKQLFPDERIAVESFVDSSLPDNFYDMAIGNPPFANVKVLADPKYKKHAFSLHDYFFAKSIDKVKPGGLMVYVTSRYTMDKQGDKARKYLGDRADLIGAIRLPQTAFMKNAGTEVVTDVLFLRKKVPGEAQFPEARAWLGVQEVQTDKGPALINEYFAAHPEMVLGTHSLAGSMYSKNEYTVLPKEGDIEAQFAAAVENLPQNIYQATGAAAEAAQVREIDFNPKAQKESNYYINDAGVLMQREGGVGVRADNKPEKTVALLKDFVKLRDALKQAHYDQLNDGPWESSLKALQKEYRAFVKKHGNILQNKAFERATKHEDEETGQEIEDIVIWRRYDLLNKINDDTDYTLVEALETLNEETGEIKESAFLTQRFLAKPTAPRIDTPHDALLSVLNDTGRADMTLIAERLGVEPNEAIAALGTAVYESPSAGWQMADEYLSGNVKQKLKEAQEAAKADRRFERNIEALLSAQPSPVPPSDITAAIGMNWIPANAYEQFLNEKTGVRADIDFNEHTKQWTVTATAGWQTAAASVDWGTLDRNAADIMDHALTGRPIRVTRMEGTGSDRKPVFDAAATEAANQKLAQMRTAFAEWLWQDGERADTLTRIYNDKFNTIVSRKFDGRHLTLPGATTLISVFDHVKRGAWRIIQAGNAYLAHSVGSGKTWQMVISAMEQKRLGLISKPMMVVPNHMLQQFAREWRQLYPAARLMVADEKQFHTDNRRRFVARVAMSDLDGVIITHSAFKLLDLDPAFKTKMIEEQLDLMRAALEEVGGEEGKKSRDPKVRDIQNRIEKMEQKLEAAMSGAGKDKNVRFDQLGVDMLYVDEAHEFRKLAFTTQRQVKGIDSSGSDRAFDLWMKTRWLEQKKPGRSLVMASGTPVTNTLAELYSVQRFMAPQVLEDRNISDFDSWAAMFGQENTEIEADASGKYSPVTRFTKFVNVPELTQMFREFSDVLTGDHLAEMLGDKRPKVKDGSRKLNITPQTDDYATYKAELSARLEASRKWKPSKGEPNNPDPIIKIIGDGRLAAIDMRFIHPSLPSDPDSKLNQMIDGVIEVFKRTADKEYMGKDGNVEPDKGGAQMVFSDLGFGAGVAEHRGFNARAWFEKRLRDAGVPAKHFAFMSDFKKSQAKLKLFQDVNAGRVRILIGSSKNMGTGVNAQQRLAALHHLDTPWYPADLEQREGRIIRQGNKNPLVEIYAYSTKGSYDTVMWQMLASKQRFIDQALSGDSSVRSIDDLTEASQFQIATAMTAGDPRAIELAGLKGDIEKYQRLFRAHEETRSRLRRDYEIAGQMVSSATAQLPTAEKLAEQVQDLSGDKFKAKSDGKTFDKRKEWAESLLATLKDFAAHGKDGRVKVGEISGFPVEFVGKIVRGLAGEVKEYRTGLHVTVGTDSYSLALDANEDAVGMAMRATNLLSTVARKPAELKQRIEDNKAKRSALEGRLDAKFQFSGELADKLKEAEALEAAMVADGKADPQQPEEAQEPEMPHLSRGTGRGMALRDLQAVVDRLSKGFKNLPRVHALSSPADLSTTDPTQKALRDFIKKSDAWADVEGATHNGEIYLFASGMADEARAEHVFATHEVTHYGLRGAVGKNLDAALQHVLVMNAKVRLKAEAMKRARGLKSNVEAIEEVLADMPASELAKLTGWRKLVKAIRDWLNKAGAKALARRLDAWMMAGMDEQAKADLFVADLVAAAREWVRTGKGQATTGTHLAEAKLADDWQAQEKWLTREAKARGYKTIDDLAEKAYPVFEKLAALWRQKHPADALLSRANKVAASFADSVKAVIADVVAGRKIQSEPLHVMDSTPAAMRAFGWSDIPVAMKPSEIDKVHFDHGMTADQIASLVPETLESPSAILTSATVPGRIVLIARGRGKKPVLLVVAPESDTKIGKRQLVVSMYPKDEGWDWVARQIRDGRLIYRDPTADAAAQFSGAVADAQKKFSQTGRPMTGLIPEIGAKLLGDGYKVLLPSDLRKMDAAPRLSRAVSSAPTSAKQTAEDVINTPAGTPRPLDVLSKGAVQALRIDKLTTALYNKAGFLLDRYTPETIKAGVVSDYGIPEAVIDQRATMQGRQKRQLRATGALIEKLSMLTRAESRVAYQWMNADDPQSADYFREQLPPESIKTLAEVEKMIDALSKEAVRLGQLDAEAFKRNRFAYLHRSYTKHTAELTKGETASRKRAIAILGDQYKGRGMTDAVDMAKFKAIAPEWWGRKLKAGQADKQLKGEKFIRLERRAPAGAGTVAMPGIGDKGRGKLLEVAYWPAAEAIPARLSTWDQAGTWEVRDTKGGKLVVWRDFTAQEREALGEIDEVRYAIAKTLHNMIHDVETGKYLEWLSQRYAKKAGEEIDGAVVEASDRMRDTYKPGEWVQVPDTKIPGTQVKKYGILAGRYLPGPIWNDVRQVVGFRYAPLGDVYAAIHRAWKTSKALALDTPIPTPGGWTTMGEIRVGDSVFDERGNVCIVMGATEVQHDRKCYEVAFSDGTKIVADAEHRWFTIMRGNAGVRTTDEIRATLKERTRGDANHKIPVAAALDLPDTDLPIPPYALGAWLGDGDTNAARLTVGGDDLDEMLANLEASGLRCGKPKKDKRNNVYTVSLRRSASCCIRGHAANRMTEKGCADCGNESRRNKRSGKGMSPEVNQIPQVTMRDIGLLGNKHIPAEYLRASEDQRRALLHGLMDTDGHVDKRGMCAFTTTLPALRDGVIELVRSLGYKPTLRNFEPECNGKKGKTAWVVAFKSYSDKPAFSLSRKNARLHGLPARPQRSQTRQIVSITPVKSVPVRCIAVSSKSRLYLAGAGMVPTHNTALSPAVHMNNVMANFVMADWHDVTAGHILKALKLMASKDAAAAEVLNRFGDSGGSIGTWATKELQQEQLRPLLDALEKELAIAGNITGQVGVMSALQLALKGRLPSAWDALKPSATGKVAVAAARAMIDLYEAEDQVFRLAAWLKAKEEGATDQVAGKAARKSFLDYSINAPWVQMLRSTALPFVAFTYRAVPMMLETAAKKPWKLMKLGMVMGAITAFGTWMTGGDDDDERKLLPEEKAGRIWGLTPKLIRMPWNSESTALGILGLDGTRRHGSPVFLDVRRWIPVGDVLDIGQSHAAIPMLPSMTPGGPLMVFAELALDKTQFTGKPITLETDTPAEQAGKVIDHLSKAFLPNLPLPNPAGYLVEGVTGIRGAGQTYAWTGIMNAGKGKTDAFDREQSLTQAVVSSVGIKLGSYSKDVLQLRAQQEAEAKIREINGNINKLKHEFARKGIDQDEFEKNAKAQIAKKQKVADDFMKRVGQ